MPASGQKVQSSGECAGSRLRSKLSSAVEIQLSADPHSERRRLAAIGAVFTDRFDPRSERAVVLAMLRRTSPVLVRMQLGYSPLDLKGATSPLGPPRLPDFGGTSLDGGVGSHPRPTVCGWSWRHLIPVPALPRARYEELAVACGADRAVDKLAGGRREELYASVTRGVALGRGLIAGLGLGNLP